MTSVLCSGRRDGRLVSEYVYDILHLMSPLLYSLMLSQLHASQIAVGLEQHIFLSKLKLSFKIVKCFQVNVSPPLL